MNENKLELQPREDYPVCGNCNTKAKCPNKTDVLRLSEQGEAKALQTARTLAALGCGAAYAFLTQREDFVKR